MINRLNMTTLAQITYQVAKKVMEVREGTASAGSSTTLTDGNLLTQTNGYWNNGTVWFLSGTHSGKVVIVSSFSGNKLTFADMGSTVGTCNYAVSTSLIPFTVLKQAVNSALDEIRVPTYDSTLTTTGLTEYSLPSGVSKVYGVESVDGTSVSKLTHWWEDAGKIKFETAPNGTLRLLYPGQHAALSAYGDAINDEVNLEWLRWASVVNCLRWGARAYQKDPTYRMDEFLNEAYRKVETLRPLNKVSMRLRTAV